MSKKKSPKKVELSIENDDDFSITEQEIISKFTSKIKDRTKYALSGVLIGSLMSPLTALIFIIIFCKFVGDIFGIQDGLSFIYQCLYSLYLKNGKNEKKN